VPDESKSTEAPKPDAPPEHPLLRRILSVPGFAISTIAVALISWGVNYAAAAITAPSQSPVQVSVQADAAQVPALGPAPQDAVLPTDRYNGTPGPGCDDFYPWARRNNGVPAPARFQIVVQSDTTQAVLITAMQVKVLRHLTAVSGPGVGCAPQAVASLRNIQIDLDAGPPSVTFRSGDTSIPFGFTLADGETEVFEVTAVTHHAHYFFDIELKLIVGGKTQEIQVTDQGQPFQATASPSSEWDWQPGGAWFLNNLTPKILAGQPFPRGG
jgi:hypothetical protein